MGHWLYISDPCMPGQAYCNIVAYQQSNSYTAVTNRSIDLLSCYMVCACAAIPVADQDYLLQNSYSVHGSAQSSALRHTGDAQW